MALLINNTNGASADYVGKTNIAGNPNIRAAHTIACRMRWTGTTNLTQYNVGFGANADQSGTYLNRTTSDGASNFFGRRYNSTLTTADSAVMTGAYSGTSAWHHYAVSYDATNIRSYLDGVLQTTTASATTRTSSTTTCNFFWALGGTYVMADVAFFGRTLTADEILFLAAGRLAPVLSKGDCFGFFPCHADNRFEDYSGFGNDASDFAGTGTAPAADNEGVPVGWARTSGRIFVPLITLVNFTGPQSSVSPTAATGTLRNKVSYTSNAATSTTSATGTLRNKVSFTAGAAASTTSATATLAVRVRFTSNVATSTTAATGTFRSQPTFAGSAASVTAATGTLNTKVLFTAGASTSTTAAVGEIEAQQRFSAGVSDSVTAAVGTIGARAVYAGDCYSRTAAQGGLTVLGSISYAGTSDTISAATGSLRASREFSGTASSTTSATGSLKALVNYAGASATTSAASGGLNVRKFFSSGTCATRSAATGGISGGTVENPIRPEDDRRREDRRRLSIQGGFRRRIR